MYLYIIFAVSPAEFYAIHTETKENFGKLIRGQCETLAKEGVHIIDLREKKRFTNLLFKHEHHWLRAHQAVPSDSYPDKFVKVNLMDANNRILEIPNTSPAVKMTKSIKSFKSVQHSLKDAEPVVGGSWPRAAREVFSHTVVGKSFQVESPLHEVTLINPYVAKHMFFIVFFHYFPPVEKRENPLLMI